MNKLFLMGRLTKDPDIKGSDKPVARFSIAVDRRYKDKDGNYPTDFFNLVSFGHTAEFVEKYLKKGTKVVVEGEIWNNNYEKDGKKIYQDQLIANNVEFAESKKSQEENKDADGFQTIDGDEDSLPFV